VLHSRWLSSPAENTGDEYLGVGLADALITRLSNVQRLIVRPTSSVLRYRGTSVDPLVAGRDLGSATLSPAVCGELEIAYVLQRSLVENVSEGATRWAEQFDED